MNHSTASIRTFADARYTWLEQTRFHVLFDSSGRVVGETDNAGHMLWMISSAVSAGTIKSDEAERLVSEVNGRRYQLSLDYDPNFTSGTTRVLQSMVAAAPPLDLNQFRAEVLSQFGASQVHFIRELARDLPDVSVPGSAALRRVLLLLEMRTGYTFIEKLRPIDPPIVRVPVANSVETALEVINSYYSHRKCPTILRDVVPNDLFVSVTPLYGLWEEDTPGSAGGVRRGIMDLALFLMHLAAVRAASGYRSVEFAVEDRTDSTVVRFSSFAPRPLAREICGVYPDRPLESWTRGGSVHSMAIGGLAVGAVGFGYENIGSRRSCVWYDFPRVA